MGEGITIYAPIEIQPSENYGLVIKDATDTYHFFMEDGTYDGYSRDCNPPIEDKTINK